MTKQEAQQAMQEGKKVIHPYLSQWIVAAAGNKYEYEDGNTIDRDELWAQLGRGGNDGWSEV